MKKRIFTPAMAVAFMVLAGGAAAGGSGKVAPLDNAALAMLKKAGGKALGCANQCVHKILGEYLFEQGKRREAIVITTSVEKGADCHACGARVSLFAFSPRGGGWRLRKAFAGFTEWGSYGEVKPGDVSLEELGRGYGVFLRAGYTGQGYYSERTEVHMEKKGRMKRVLALCTGEDNEGAAGRDSPDWSAWSARYSVSQNKGRTSTLKVTVTDGRTKRRTTSAWRFANGKFTPMGRIDHRLTDCLED